MMNEKEVVAQTSGEALFKTHAAAIAAQLQQWKGEEDSVTVDGHPFNQATDALAAYNASQKDFAACMAFIEAIAIHKEKAIQNATLFKTSGINGMTNLDGLRMNALSGQYGDIWNISRDYFAAYTDRFSFRVRQSFLSLSFSPSEGFILHQYCVIKLDPLQKELDAFYKELHNYRCNLPASDPHSETIRTWITNKDIPDHAKMENRKSSNEGAYVFGMALLCFVVGLTATVLWVHEELPGVKNDNVDGYQFYLLGSVGGFAGALIGLAAGLSLSRMYLIPKLDREIDKSRGPSANQKQPLLC